jgi:tRNA nucleotidyltransferase (CCA-adding enzyme)
MADYIYLLENRLSTAQRAALLAVRDVVKAKG